MEKLPGKFETSGKSESKSASLGYGWTDLEFLFQMFVIVRIRVLGKEKLVKLPGKLENYGKPESEAALLENGWTDLAIFFNIHKSPNKVFRESKIRKVARKIGKF